MKYDERTCKFNMDTGCVELLLRDGRKISIDCTGVEDALDVTMAQRSELDYLIYNDPLGYADLILNGDPKEYLKNVTESHGLEDAEMLKWLCSKGYVAAGINYTLFTEENPDASVYSQSEEIKAAMPSVVAAAEKLGYKLDRMAIAGGSAGGCLALIYAYRDADTSPLPVKMVFEAVGPGSFHVEDWGIFGLDQSPEAAAGLFSVMSGQALTPEDITSGAYLDAVKPISADRWVTKDTVPSVLCYGAHDKMQPFAASKPLVAALEKNGVDYRYFVAKHSGHGLQNDNKVYMEYLDTVVEYLDKYMKE